MAFGRRVLTLAAKNLRIVLWRNPGPTSFTALFLPVALAIFLSLTRRLAAPPSVFGIGTATPVQTLGNALDSSGTSGAVVLVSNGHSGGAIDHVIDVVAGQVTDVGHKVTRLTSEDALRDVCRSSQRGVTNCFGAVVFNASPDEGDGGIWNYTLRADSALGHKIRVDRHDNSPEVYLLPLQRAVDAAITSLSPTGNQSALPQTTDEYPFTSITDDEFDEQTRRAYQTSVINYLAVSFMMVFIGACYHLTSFMTLERETGMTELLEAMMPCTHYWEAQAARFLAYHLSFTLVYFPGWIIASVVLGRASFPDCNLGTILVYFLLCGMALVSLSVLAATFFSKSQLSNVSLILYAALGIIAQVIHSPSTAAVAVLSLLFAPCNFVFYIIWIAKWEAAAETVDLSKSAPESSWALPGIVLWVFLIVQIPVYLLVGALIERAVHGSAAKRRINVLQPDFESNPDGDDAPAIRITNLSKNYNSSLLSRLLHLCSPRSLASTPAVSNLNLVAERGQILALLGANGSGKSTILSSIAGIVSPSSGTIALDISQGVGIAPQKDVLWDDLTVSEHIEIFHYLKSADHIHDQPGSASQRLKADTEALVNAVDLSYKSKALSKTLSGGQKRKLQLAMMLAGGSRVCCVDEVSSSLDPVSRRKVWDILLQERGRRTIILTTHFLDEAEVLADRVVVLSKGMIRAEGSVPELKSRGGSGWRVCVKDIELERQRRLPPIPGLASKVTADGCTYVAETSADAARLIEALEAIGVSDYTYEEPKLENVFFRLADEVKEEERKLGTKLTASSTPSNDKEAQVEDPNREELGSMPGTTAGPGKQIYVLFLKRLTLLKRDWLPYLAALALPIVAAGITSLLVHGEHPGSCASTAAAALPDTTSWNSVVDNGAPVVWVLGPLLGQSVDGWPSQLFSPLFGNPDSARQIFSAVDLATSIDEFDRVVKDQRRTIAPAGLWLGNDGSLPTLAYRADEGGMYTAMLGQNALDMMLTNTTIATSYIPFDSPQVPSPGKSLQLVLYLCLALSLSTAFFGLYPNVERLHGIKDLEYSNGVLPLSLWASHIAFDSLIILLASAVVTIIFASLSSIWFHIGYLFLILVLYGLASTLLAYIASLLAASQSATFGAATGVQGFGTLIYFIVYSLVSQYAPVGQVDSAILIVHFVLSLFAPIGSMMRALFVAVNLNSVSCSGDELSSSPGSLTLYGGPILYLLVQSIVSFAVLLFADSSAGAKLAQYLTTKPKAIPLKSTTGATGDAAGSNDVVRTASGKGNEMAPSNSAPCPSPPAEAQTTSGLALYNLTKTFKSTTVVSSLSLTVVTDTIFALLGPNGAGKSVTLSLIRGLLPPDRTTPPGDIFVAGHSMVSSSQLARRHLGVCPQVDALDSMSVRDHLVFYARIKGVEPQRTDGLLRAVGLQELRNRNANQLSGGEKRKLSLAIALLGDPAVVLLDEPSCGLDVVAKRAVWRVIREVGKGRAVLMTSHSMEEAEALAGQVGILAGPGRMTVFQTQDELRSGGEVVVLHVVCKTNEDADRVRRWVEHRWPAAKMAGGMHGRQLRLGIPASQVGDGRGNAIGRVVVAIEANKEELGVAHYSVGGSTLDQVFLRVIGDGWQQEDEERRKEGWKGVMAWCFGSK